MDSRAKQRLTGAVILVALFVLLVPELLTGPRNAGGDAPSEEGMRRYTIDLDAPPGGAQPQAPTEHESPVALPPVAETSAHDADTRAVPGEAAQPATIASVPVAPAAAAAAATPTPMATPPRTVASAAPDATAKPAATVSPKPAQNPPPSNTATRTDAPRPAPIPAAAVKGGAFAVQLGSFVSRENAERLVRDMTAKGFNAFLAPTIKTGGRDLYRVRVGPTRDRAAAEALASQLRRMGQQGSVVSIS